MRPVDATQLDATLAALEPGDRVSVLTPSGWRDNHYVIAVTETALELETFGDERVTVDRTDLWELQVPVVSRGKRIALIGGIATAVWFILLDDAGYELDF
ncbi:MAG TPA: hypothetical protein VKA43_07040 [Gammaproteobacteria bacterium]|nr:hypothetical protein [Gammaproteobacteria bacterium]